MRDCVMKILAKQHHMLRKQVQVVQVIASSTLLYGCETWTLCADSEKRIQAFGTKCLRKVLGIVYSEHKTNHWVRNKVSCPLSPRKHFLVTVIRDGDLHESGM